MKKVKSIILLTLCAMLICISFIATGLTSAKSYAYGDVPGGESASSGEDEKTYTSFYYFSDNADAGLYFNGFMTEIIYTYGIEAANCFRYDLCKNNDIYDTFKDYLKDGVFSNIGDAFIVFEMTTILKVQCYERETPFIEDLRDVFEAWHDNGCKIMFICNTDESRFKQFNELLDYVDIHINTDLMTLLMYHVIGEILDNNDDNMNGVTFIINEGADYIVKEYLVPYFRFRYNLPAYNSNFDTDKLLVHIANPDVKFYDGDKIRVIVQNEDVAPSYIDYAGDGNVYSVIDYLDEANPAIDYNKAYAIGALCSQAEEADMALWLRDLAGIQEEKEVTFPIFAVNSINLSLAAQYGIEVYQLSAALYNFYQGSDFGTIFSCFVNGGDLTAYDNYDGRCAVTYKTIIYGSNGWLNLGSNYFSCWDIYMSEDDYYFYF